MPKTLPPAKGKNITVVLDSRLVEQQRTRLKLSQEQAAVAAGLGFRQTWSRFEAADRPISMTTLSKIAGVLGLDPRKLIKVGRGR